MKISSITDDSSLSIIEAIKANHDARTPVLLTRLKISRKQYYSRITRLLKAGIVSKKQGQYRLTSFGIIFVHAVDIMNDAAQNKWRLDALDCAPPEYRGKILEALIVPEMARILNV